MTRKDYELIAGGIAYAAELSKVLGGIDAETRDRIALLIAQKIGDGLAEDNPRFNRELFLKACGVAL
jgi:hypothetical protein